MMRWKIWCMNDFTNLNVGWTVSNGITSYTAKTEQEANWLKDQLSRVSEPAEPLVVSGFTREAIDELIRAWQLGTPSTPTAAEFLAG